MVTPVANEPKASRKARPSKRELALTGSTWIDVCVVILNASNL
jgi:hypothetical protein